MPLPTIGAQAPAFSLPSDAHGQINLSDYSGRALALFFYPRDSTSGCTIEARDFTALEPQFTAAGCAVLGVSKDSLRKHANFRSKQDLSIPLLSDEGGTMCEDYGVWAEKKMYGKSFMGIVRSSFLISADGRIAQIWSPVKVAGHAAEVLEAAQAL